MLNAVSEGTVVWRPAAFICLQSRCCRRHLSHNLTERPTTLIGLTDMTMDSATAFLAVFSFLSVSLKDGCCHEERCVLHREEPRLVVNCSHVGLTSLPKKWSSGVTDVDLSYNRLESLQGLSCPELSQVRHVDVSHNLLHTLEQEMLSGLPLLESVDLSHNQLAFIQPHAFLPLTSLRSLHLNDNQLQGNLSAQTFQGLSGLQELDLSHNQLSVLLNGTFSCMNNLTSLRVTANHLEKLEREALVGLNSAISLDLSKNRLELTPSVFPNGAFSFLPALQELRLQFNDRRHWGKYPEHLFDHLPALRYLALDTFYEPCFGQDFAALSQLETLDLGFNCKIRRLTNDSLRGFRLSSLRVLVLNGCGKLLRIESCAFCSLPNLKTLRLGAHYLNPRVSLLALYGFQNQTMDEIDLSFHGSWGRDTYLIDKESTQYLINICVSSFRMHDSRLRRIKTHSLGVNNSRFSECIQHIDFSENNLEGDVFELLRWLIFFHRLQTLEIQDQQTFSVHNSDCILSGTCKNHFVSFFFISGGNLSFTITLSPALRLFNISAVVKHLSPLPPHVIFQNADTLRALDLSYSTMANCKSTLHGLGRLETLMLNFNYCYNISDTLLDNLPSLKHLGLVNFGAPNQFYLDRGRRFFQHLRRLEQLDLSLNQLLRLPADMLQSQAGVTHLRFSSNRFQSVPVNLGYHDNLTSLDLSYNMLPTLTVEERTALDRLADRHEFRLRLLGNPLACTCHNLDMVQWLWHTPVTLDGEGTKGNYSCSLDTGEMTDTSRVMAAMLPHWRKCVGLDVFAVALGLLLSQLLLLLLTYVIYSHWTRLQYAWRALRRHRLPDRLRDFSKDANFVYADTDRDVLWACRTLPALLHQHRPGLRLLLQDMEPLPTMNKAENIAQYIDVSWKTVLLVTQDFSRDDWACSFAVRQVTHCTSDLTPERVIIVFLERPHLLDLMPSLQLLLPLVPPHHVFHVHPLVPAHHPVWRALADAITGDQRS